MNLSRIKTNANRILGWWLEGLRLPLPTYLQNRLFPAKTPVPVLLQHGLYTLPGGESAPQCSDLSLALEQFNRQYDSKTHFPVICLDEADVLLKRIALPKAAPGQLASLVHFELQRVLPLSLTDVRYGYFVEDERLGTRVTVTVVIVPLVKIQNFLEQLKSIKAAIPLTGSSDGKMLPVDLSTRPGAKPCRQYVLPIKPKFAALLLLAVLFYTAAPYFYYAGKVAQLQVATTANRERAVALREEIAARASGRNEDAFIAVIEKDYFSPLNVLRSLTELLPDNTWLQTFAISNGRVQLQGESPSAADTLAQVESAGFMEQAEFLSPVAPGDDALNEQFHIIANLRTANEP